MQSRTQHDPRIAATEGESELALANELRILRDVFRMLPTGVTVQDEQGRFLLVNDAAAAQLRMAGSEPDSPTSKELDDRRQTGIELLRTGRHAVAEECISSGQTRQVLLTSHRPVRIADRDLLLSSSADISEQKDLEDHLFRSAYYDELTGLPNRGVIEHRVNSLLHRDQPHGRFALAFLDIDNFKHIN
ncbi:MAG: diguanylate cyclase, partial [Bradyrhizobium sp.]|nr:diguanylate cyclase [Bradyrhizobium sp.]